MPSKIFEGKDKFDLDKQMWDWKSANPKIKELKRYPIERLPWNVSKGAHGAKLSSPNVVSIRIDYEESN